MKVDLSLRLKVALVVSAADAVLAGLLVAWSPGSADAVLTSLGAAVVAFVVGFPLGYLVSGLSVRSLRRLTYTADAVVRGAAPLEVLTRVEPDSLTRDEVGHLRHVLAILARQIRTQLDEVAAERERAIVAEERAVAASRAKSAFLANMSHELRTPLTAILGYADLLHEDAVDNDNELLAADLERIRSSGRHLLTLIDDLLDLSKIEAGHLEVLLEPTDAVEVVHHVANEVRQLAAQRCNHVVVRVGEGVGPILTDPLRLRQCLLNLLANACKFTQEGTIRLSVETRHGTDGGWMVFEVEDDGIGMTEEQLQRVFGEFIQADAGTTRRFGGTGLGLALTRRLARLLGGTVEARSQEGVGSTFTMRIPSGTVAVGATG